MRIEAKYLALLSLSCRTQGSTSSLTSTFFSKDNANSKNVNVDNGIDVIPGSSHRELLPVGSTLFNRPAKINGGTSGSSTTHCNCEGCSGSTWDAPVGGHTCGEKITMFQEYMGSSEIDACRQVAGIDFVAECGACDPDTCGTEPPQSGTETPETEVTEYYTEYMAVPPQDVCQNELCTQGVWDTVICDESRGGCHTCGDRIQHLIVAGQQEPVSACDQIAYVEFPEQCGGCMPQAEEPVETADNIVGIIDGVVDGGGIDDGDVVDVATEDIVPEDLCVSSECTAAVWDTETCDYMLGGCYSCGDRIEYLVLEEDYEPTKACEQIAFKQFPIECGGCIPDALKAPVEPASPSNLVWSDEFGYTGSPDPTKWKYDIGTGDNGWGNNELQYYTDSINNTYVSDGTLKIRAVREDYLGSTYTSGRMVTYEDWTYGRVQVKVRLSNTLGRGTWGAAWMLPTDWAYGIWPLSGEIDIMEHVGYEPGVVHGTVHTDSFNHMKGTQDGGKTLVDIGDWHVYEVIWTEEKIDFLVDGFRYHTFVKRDAATFREWPFDENFHILLNLAVGGFWGGLEGIDEQSFVGNGHVMEVDYVRVYSLD